MNSTSGRKAEKQRQLAALDLLKMDSLDALEPSDKPSRNPSIRGKFPFELGMGPAKKLRLVADTEADRSLWLSALRAARASSWAQDQGE